LDREFPQSRGVGKNLLTKKKRGKAEGGSTKYIEKKGVYPGKRKGTPLKRGWEAPPKKGKKRVLRWKNLLPGGDHYLRKRGIKISLVKERSLSKHMKENLQCKGGREGDGKHQQRGNSFSKMKKKKGKRR